MAELKRYVDSQGRMRSLTPEHAKQLGGYTLVKEKGQPKAAEANTVDVEEEQAAQDTGGSEAAKARTAIEEPKPADRKR